MVVLNMVIYHGFLLTFTRGYPKDDKSRGGPHSSVKVDLPMVTAGSSVHPRPRR